MLIGRFKKGSADRKRYTVDYSNWMATDENVATVIISGTILDGFYIDGYAIGTDPKTVNFFVSGGLPGGDYVATITISTDKGQVKQDTIAYEVI